MVTVKNKPAHWSKLTSGDYTGWGDPYEQSWSWLEGYDLLASSWARDASCIGMDPELFFADDTQLARERITRICGPCPVRDDCLKYAVDNNEYGWWGGTCRKQRRGGKRG